ncbi:hypothetical protein HanPSC8_Chr14g0608211 [Helianthus annuus]|nr:hypothetical protein HanPSC8_Chr14g0608211 [Helianthus annuus]
MNKWQNRDNIFSHQSNNPHKRLPRSSRVPDLGCVCIWWRRPLWSEMEKKESKSGMCSAKDADHIC